MTSPVPVPASAPEPKTSSTGKSLRTSSKRKFQFGSKESGVTIIIKESFSEFLSHVWPSAILMSEYLWTNPNIVVNQHILELGAGCGMPSILCCKLGPKSVIATDNAVKNPELMINLNASAALNGTDVEALFRAIGLTWGRFTKQNISLRPTVIIGSDIFYDDSDFEDILATVQYYFNHGCNEFYSVVQKRGTSRYLGVLLMKWRMRCEEIDIVNIALNSDFLALEESERLMLVKITPMFIGSHKNKHHRMESVMGLLSTPTPTGTQSSVPILYPSNNNNNNN